MAQVLTAVQRAKLAKAIRLRHSALLVELLGDNAVTKSTLAAIKAAGLYKTPSPDIIHRAIEYGRESVIEPRVLKMKRPEFEAYLKTRKGRLSPKEVEAVTVLRRSFVHYMQTNAQAFQAKLFASVIKADKALTRKTAQIQLRRLTFESARREAVATVAKDLAQITIEQLGNVDRVVSTETHNAYQDGRAQEILRKSAEEGIEDPWVFKRPRIDACDACKAVYLREDGVTPKLFRLSKLMANGSNVGKVRADRQATLDSQHPWCACSLHMLPRGYGFDAEGNMVYVGTSAERGAA